MSILKAASSFNTPEGRTVPLGFTDTIRDGWQALDAAGINYRIESLPLSDLTDAPMADRFHAAVRSSDGAIVGVNSDKFVHHQPSDLAALGDAIVKVREDAYFSAGGQSRDGRLQFLVVTLNDTPFQGRDGGSFQSIMLVNGTNGNCLLRGVAFNFRLTCMNQFPAIRRNGANIFSLGHTWSAKQALPTAVTAIQTAAQVFDEFDWNMRRLLEVEIGNPLGVAAEIAGKRPEEEGRALTEWNKRFDAIVAEYHADHNVHVRGTGWGVVMAAQGVDEHYSRVKHGERGLQRNMRIINGGYPLMERALALV
jgi:hypothetical protein